MSRDQKRRSGSGKPLSFREQFQRRRGTRDPARRFLIVCEDGKSAPNYFEALKQRLNLSATLIDVVRGNEKTDPNQIVVRAITLKKNAAQPDSGTLGFDQVWCVIDGDSGVKVKGARRKAESKDVKLAITTMCFEYWLLLHFEKNGKSAIQCDAHVRSLKKHIPEYEKGKCDFGKIVDQVRVAARRAEELRKPGIARGENPEDQNPCSEVYKLIDAILAEPEADRSA